MRSIPDLLRTEGFLLSPSDTNIIYAEKAFFAARVIKWIRERGSRPDFNLQAYLIALTYYRLGVAQLKFSDDDELLYRYVGVTDHEGDDEDVEANPESHDQFCRPDEFFSKKREEEPEVSPDD